MVTENIEYKYVMIVFGIVSYGTTKNIKINKFVTRSKFRNIHATKVTNVIWYYRT